jgi:hypothetical protein
MASSTNQEVKSMYVQAFKIIYAIRIESGVDHSQILERDFGLKPMAITEDDRRNLPDLYRELFDVEGEQFMKSLVNTYMKKLSEASLDNSNDIIEALDLLQGVIMTARAQYEIPVNRDLYSFAQRYDRLDDEEIRTRLYKEAIEQNRKA